MSIASINPWTGETLKVYTPHNSYEVEQKIDYAWDCYLDTIKNLDEVRKARVGKLLRLAEILENEKDDLGALMVTEMGKPLRQAIQEVEKCAKSCRYYAETGLKALQASPVISPSADSKRKAEIQYHPIGVVLSIMPWNFPFWQVIRGLAPILLGGNSVVLKHASNVPGCALAIEKLCREAGFSECEFQTILVPSSDIEKIIQDKRIAAVTLTGSEGAGRSVGAEAGRAIKKVVLELGGSDPFVVMPSADLGKAVEAAALSRLVNNGQSCISAKRFIIHEKIYESFRERFIARMKAAVTGDPMKMETELGPLSSRKACEDLHALVDDAVKKGAKVCLGGEFSKGKGAFYPATVIENISFDARIRDEEAFGPVAALYRVRDLDEAIALANSTRFALASSFWSKDEAEIKVAVAQIEAGSTFVNEMVASDPRLPFGGIKSSGHGRELSQVGLYEFVNIKTIVQS